MLQILKMYDAMAMNQFDSFIINEHANLKQNYQYIYFLIKDLSEIIKILEMKIQLMERNQETEAKKVVKRCKLFNTGFCKSEGMCPFLHPDSICDDYLKLGNCDQYRSCLKRHPKECRDCRHRASKR